ncbi:MAG: GNAT family N-acetyltransferase [Alphaproteobacteria bacterium]|nr:GNAT family N-acetyltransferase [Alphaproteobacteria bacterium]
MKTTRLVLRPLCPADAPAVAALGGDWDVASMTARMPYPYTPEAAHNWITSLDEGETVYAIKLDDTLIGVTGFTANSDQTGAEIGYWLGKPYWGQGLATEATRALINHCFTHEGFEAVTCCHFGDNPASARVIEKIGFTRIGNCKCWCEAERLEKPAVRYQLSRPPTLWRRLAQFANR